MDPVQLIVSFVAIVLLAGLAFKLFPDKDVLTLASAREDYARYNPDAALGEALLGLDHKAALFPMDTELGIVTKLGDQLVCRTLHTGEIANYQVQGDTIFIVCKDFTLPAFTIRLGASDMSKAETLLAAYSTPTGASHAA